MDGRCSERIDAPGWDHLYCARLLFPHGSPSWHGSRFLVVRCRGVSISKRFKRFMEVAKLLHFTTKQPSDIDPHYLVVPRSCTEAFPWLDFNSQPTVSKSQRAASRTSTAATIHSKSRSEQSRSLGRALIRHHGCRIHRPANAGHPPRRSAYTS